MILLLTVMILEMDFQVRADLRAATYFQEDIKAYHLARSAISAGEALLRRDLLEGTQYDAPTELWAAPILEYPLGDGVISGTITDESGKFNLNSLIKNGLEAPRKSAQFKRLLEHLGLDPDRTSALRDTILDWMDSDPLPRPYGAEEETYARLDPTYAPKNGPLLTLGTLHMMHGMTDDLYRKISPYVTVYGDPSNTAGKININTAEAVILESLEGFDAEMARRLIDDRPFETMADYLGHYPAGNDVDVKSNTFSIRVEGRVNQTRKIIHAVLQRGPTPKQLYIKVE